MHDSSHSPGYHAGAPDLVVRGNRVITPEGERAAAIHVRGEAIAAITDFGDVPASCMVYEAENSVVMPGLVDTHVHINEPGRSEWEGFSCATRAAAAGGVTTLIEMPLNSIPATTSAAAFREKTAAAAGKLWVDTGFWGGVVPENAAELRPLWEAGVFGFKCFLVPSGVAEFGEVAEPDLRAALAELAAMGAPLLVHAEIPGPIAEATSRNAGTAGAARKYSGWLASRPAEAEIEAIALMIRLAREFKARVHIVHLSASGALDFLEQARAEGLAVTLETCPHYLTFAAEEIADGRTEFKCAPPIREADNREELWAALGRGMLDCVVTDHSPCPPAKKLPDEGDFMRAWGGIASLQLSLPALWTQARSRGYSVAHVAAWMCAGPARLAGLQQQKGALKAGSDADLVIWNPDAWFRVDATQLHHRHKTTPYAGRELAGVVEATFLRGRKIFDRGEFSSGPIGQVLRRGSQ